MTTAIAILKMYASHTSTRQGDSNPAACRRYSGDGGNACIGVPPSLRICSGAHEIVRVPCGARRGSFGIRVFLRDVAELCAFVIHTLVIVDSHVDVEGRMTGTLGFLFYSAIALAPVLIAVSVASHFFRRDRLIPFALVTVVLGFLAGGVVGWASVPAQWTASFWTTIEAAGNAAKYGHAFEHTAERALMYFFFSALLGEVAFGLAALVVVWR